MSRYTEHRSTAQEARDAGAKHESIHADDQDRSAARNVSLAGLRREAAAIQQKRDAGSAPANEVVHAAAARGVASPTTALPHAERIQASFGAAHDVSQIQAHVGGNAAGAMGATAFASGSHVVFDKAPDLHTAAHEAAHVVQQARGVSLYGGVGDANDSYERQADAVADRVVAGEPAADLLGAPSARASSEAGPIQRKAVPKVSDATPQEQQKQHDKADQADLFGLQSAIQVVAKQLEDGAIDIYRLIASPPGTAAGAEPQMQAVRARLDKLGSVTVALRGRIGMVAHESSGMTKDAAILRPDVGALQGAQVTLSNAVAKAAQFGATHGAKLGTNVDFVTKEINLIKSYLKIEGELKIESVDERPLATIVSEAVGQNLTAVREAALSVRMGLATGDPMAVSGDMQKVVRHIKEVADLVREITDRKQLKSYRDHVRSVLSEVRRLEADLAGKQALADMLKADSVASAIHEIQSKVGH
jgi:hypothetical protein